MDDYCSAEEGCVAGATTDCDDEEATTYPGADEICDDVDNDCDDDIDDEDEEVDEAGT